MQRKGRIRSNQADFESFRTRLLEPTGHPLDRQTWGLFNVLEGLTYSLKGAALKLSCPPVCSVFMDFQLFVNCDTVCDGGRGGWG